MAAVATAAEGGRKRTISDGESDSTHDIYEADSDKSIGCRETVQMAALIAADVEGTRLGGAPSKTWPGRLVLQ